MTPVCIYIDGFNLYHALVRFEDHKLKWLDLRALSQRLISSKTEEVKGIFYFSAYAHWLPDKMARHRVYVKALEAVSVTCILGHFKNKDRKCNSCGATWIAHEEKETDDKLTELAQQINVEAMGAEESEDKGSLKAKIMKKVAGG